MSSVQASASAKLFSPIKVGNMTLLQRIAMSPMTRSRGDKDYNPRPEVTTYYEQRADAPGTLLITEGAFVSPGASGYSHIPSLWSKSQIQGWKKVVDAVHAKKSFLYVQLWHLGRLAGEDTLKALDPKLKVVGPSTIPGPDKYGSNFTNNDKASIPTALTKSEIKQIVKEFAEAASNAVKGAGADSVEIHAANGYLPHQFLSETSNNRTDEYGGSVENRARFVLELVDAVVEAVGADRTGIRLSPFINLGDCGYFVSPVPQYAYLIEELEKRAQKSKAGRLAYIHIFDLHKVKKTEPDGTQTTSFNTWASHFVREIWQGTLIRTGDYELKNAIETVNADDNVVIGFGRKFLSNPDLVTRLKTGASFTPVDYPTLYAPGSSTPEKGYTDYPFLHKK